MLLRDEQTSLRLAVVGYQFPLAPDAQQRFSWHVIEGAGETKTDRWRFRFPALTCSETPRVAMWLTAVADWLADPVGLPVPERLSFTEPNLAFSVAERGADAVCLVVELDREFKPPWRRGHPGYPHHLRVLQDGVALRNAAAAWSAEARAFPDGLDPVAPAPPGWNQPD